MFVKFITSKLLRVIVYAAAGLYGLYNAISCFATLYKAEHPKDLAEKEHPHSGGSGSGRAVRFWAGVLDGRRKNAGDGRTGEDLDLQQKGK